MSSSRRTRVLPAGLALAFLLLIAPAAAAQDSASAGGTADQNANADLASAPEAFHLPGPPGPSLTLDIADLTAGTDPLLRVAGPSGPTTFGFLGTPVAGGFDMDGDGHGDYAVGHMTTSDLTAGRIFAGEVQLVFGDGTTSGAVDLDVDQPRVLRILGAGFFEATGSEVWMGDITGDGLGDLLVHRQNFDPGGRIGAGALTVVVGGPELRTLADGGVLDLAAPDPSVTIFNLVGAAENDRLGMWARTGDVDGDGIDELIVAADQVSSATETFRGAVYVVRGGPHLAQNATVDLADFGSTILAGDLAQIVPPAGSDDFHFGATLQAGDLDRDHKAEIFIAAALNRAGAVLSPDGNFTGDAVGGPPGGRLWIVWDESFPHGTWPAGLTIDLENPPHSLTTISGGVQNVSFGEEVLGGLDYNRDRRPDLFIGDLAGDGSPDQDEPFAGIGYVIYNAKRLKGKTFNIDDPPRWTRITKILGPIAGAIGSDTVAHGDFNGDGFDDLMIGNPHDNPQDRFHAGTMHVIFGRGIGWPRRIDTAPGELPPRWLTKITLIEGAIGRVVDPDTGQTLDEGDTLAYSAAAGDVDGDGRTDLITNEMVGNGVNQVDVGNLIILDGEFISP